MASRKEYDMRFSLNAQLGSGYTSTFTKAQQQLVSMQKEIQALAKTQSDITAYQRQQVAAENTQKKLETLQQQYDNIKKEMDEAGEYSSALANKLLEKQQQIDKTSDSLETKTRKLEQMSAALREAGVDTGNLSAASAQLKVKTDEIKRAQEDAAEKARKFGDASVSAFTAIHQAVLAAGLAKALKEIYGLFSECADAAMSYEDAMAAASATTDTFGAELAAMGKELKALATDIPVPVLELAKLAEMAGQLGIEKENVIEFSRVMSAMAVTTTLTSEEAAMNLAKFANITQISQKDFERLGSTFLEIGDSMSATDNEIANMAPRLAAAGHQAGMTTGEIVALAGALASMGVEAQAGGSSFSKIINEMTVSVEVGNERLEDFARIAGVSAQEFAVAYKENAASALVTFIEGLSDLERHGKSTIALIDELGINETRLRDSLARTASAGDLLRDALELGNEAWRENIALSESAAIRYDTTKNQLVLLQNAQNNLRIAIGDAYTPTLKELYSVSADVLGGVTEFIEKNPELVRAMTAGVAVLGTVTVGLAVYTVAARVATVATKALTAAIPGVKAIMAVTGGVALLAGAVAAFSGANKDGAEDVDSLTYSSREQYHQLQELRKEYERASVVADVFGDRNSETSERAIELKRQVEELTAEYQRNKKTIEEHTAEKRASAAASAELLSAHRDAAARNDGQEQYETYLALLEKAEELELDVTDALLEKGKAQERYNKAIKLVQTGTANQLVKREFEAAKDALSAMEEAHDLVAAAMEEARGAIDNYSGALGEAYKGNAELQGALAGTRGGIVALIAAYEEAYDAALDSIGGQYALWDKAERSVATSAGAINAAIESQMLYWREYNNNIVNLTNRTGDIEGLSEMIATFADGSTDSVNAIAGMAAASDADLSKMVKNWKALQDEQKTVSESLGLLVTGFGESINEIQKELEEAIAEMDLGEEAAKSGKNTIQGFIDGAAGMTRQVEEAYGEVAQAAIDAIDNRLKIQSPSREMEYRAEMTWLGFIKQTQEMRPLVAAAMSGSVGAGIEAAADTPALMADSGGGGGYGIGQIVISPQYSISGIDNPEGLEAVFDAQNDTLREVILEVISDREADAARRGNK